MAEGVNFTIRADGTSAVSRALVQLQLSIRLHELLTEIGASLLTSTQRRFEDEQAPSGAPWDPIQRDGSILRDSGHLYQSLTYVAGQSQVEVGTNVVYARIHQMGGQAGRGRKLTITPRPFLGLDDADRRELMEIVNDYVREALP